MVESVISFLIKFNGIFEDEEITYEIMTVKNDCKNFLFRVKVLPSSFYLLERI